MATSKVIIEWFERNALAINLEITELVWTRNVQKKVYDFKVGMSVEGISFNGRGLDSDPDTAIVKAMAEAYERLCYDNYKHLVFDTTGIATHSSFELAKEAALNELIERQQLFNFFDSNSSGRLVKSPRDKASKAIIEWVKESGAEIIFKELSSIENRKTIICAINGRESQSKFGWIFGYGTNKNIEIAKSKALLEAIMNFSYVMDKNNSFSFSVRDGKLTKNRFEMLLSSQMYDFYANWILKNDEGEYEDKTDFSNQYHVEILEPSMSDIFCDIPLVTVRVFDGKNLNNRSLISKRSFQNESIPYPLF